MRKFIQGEYLRKGLLLSRNNDTEEYASIGKPFRFKELKSTHQSSQHVGKFMMTDTTTSIETVSDLDFQVGDKVVINESQIEILNVEYVPFEEYGIIRGVERYKKVITLP